MFIYIIKNKINNKVYVGQTTRSITRRFDRHCRGNNESAICRAIKKYGRDNFYIEEIDGANSLSELNYKEKHYIIKLDSISPKGYNIRSGGDNKIMSEKTKRKISINTKKAMKCPEVRKKCAKGGLEREPWNKGKKGLQTRNMKVKCIETKKEFKNQLDVANWLKCSKSAVSAHITGRLKHIKGYTFVKIEEL